MARVTVLVRKISDISDDGERKIIESLSPAARERLEKKRNAELRRASLCALSLLSDAQRGSLCYEKDGRPYFQGLDSDISLSHSRLFAVAAISDGEEIAVGVDVEDGEGFLSAERFFSEGEKKMLSDGESAIEIWTRKEALFKCLSRESGAFEQKKTLLQTDASCAERAGLLFASVKLCGAHLTVCAPVGTEIIFPEEI